MMPSCSSCSTRRGGTIETDFETPLHQRYGCPALFADKGLHFRVQRVLGRVAAAHALARGGFHAPLGEVHLVRGAQMPLPVGHHGLHFLIAQKRPVQALQPAAAGFEEHVAPAQQMFRAH